MPRVMHPHLLRSVFEETTRLIESGMVPTEPVQASHTVFRCFDQHYAYINTDGVFPRHEANAALVVRDQFLDVNRFTGQSFSGNIPAAGGLYCSLQAQAIVNEMSHYARSSSKIPRSGATGFPNIDATLRGKCIVRIRLMSTVLAADISNHNPGTRAFLDELGRAPGVQMALRNAGRGMMPLSQQVNESEDCSIARGIGLAFANTPWIKAMKATTARQSDRSEEEQGDNLIFFGGNGSAISGIWIEEAYLFPLQGPPVVYPVNYAPKT